MKVKEIDFSAYEHKRVSIYHINSDFFPPDKEEMVKTMYGEEEVDHVEVTETGLMIIYTTIQ